MADMMRENLMSKQQFDNLSEDGYFSGANTSRAANHDAFMITQDYKNTNINFEKYAFDDIYQPLSSSINDPISSRMEGKGILFDRLKEAQDTIDQLSTKLFYCENEIAILSQRKHAFETGYHKLEKENKQLLMEKIVKERLLKKINNMDAEVSNLLKTHQQLVDKHHEQEKSHALLKMQTKLLEEENQSLKIVNNTLTSTSEEEKTNLEELKVSQQEVSNKLVITNIEKNALSSEYDRMVKTQHQSEQEIQELRKHQKKLEKLLEESTHKLQISKNNNSSLEEQNNFFKSELQVAVERKITIEKVMSEEVNQIKKQNEVVLTTNEMLEKELITKKELCDQLKSRIEEISGTNTVLKNQSCELERQYRELLSTNSLLENNIEELKETVNKTEREEMIMSQKLSVYESEKENHENQLKKLKKKSDANVTEFDARIQKLQKQSLKMKEVYLAEKEKMRNEYEVKVKTLVQNKKCLEESNAQLSLELNDLKEKFFKLEHTLDSVRKENTKHASIQYQEISELESVKAKITEECKNLRTENIQYDAQIDEYSLALQDVKSKYDHLNRNFNEKVNKIQNLEKQVKDLSTENNDLKSKDKGNTELIDLLQKQSKSEILAEQKTSAKRIQSLETQIKDYQEQCQKIRDEKEKNTKLHEQEISGLLNNHQKKFEEKLNEKHELQAQCKSLTEKTTMYSELLEQKQSEIEKLSSLNTSNGNEISNLKAKIKELQAEEIKASNLKNEIKGYKKNVEELESRVAIVTTENEILLGERKDSTKHTSELLERLNLTMKKMEEQSKQMHDDKENRLTEEQQYKKEIRDLSYRNERLKSELRQRTLQKHSACGEIEMIKSEHVNVKKELAVLAELNRKLEEVHSSLQEDNKKYRSANEQLQVDMQTLKSSFENLLAKELEKQKSEFLQQENELLKKLSLDYN
ncbi:myosin-11-like [Hydractinia symbiolongicarpus]|uniref:myosin-11-like n=1 Tax=Hydractinia symbiolongicarpus TaxID=13093 RepID=UPI00254D6194|nr:myosin-11-like [Hydractinia symbiolongicarpus]